MSVNRIKRGSLGGLVVGLAVVTGVLLAAAPVGAGTTKTVCHGTGNGSFHAIEVSESAVPAHLKHGDGLVGDAVPGQAAYVFGESCQLVPARGNTPPVADDDSAYDLDGHVGPVPPGDGQLPAFDADGDVLTYYVVSTDPDVTFESETAGYFNLDGTWRAFCTGQYGLFGSLFSWSTFTWWAYDGQDYSNVATQAVNCPI